MQLELYQALLDVQLPQATAARLVQAFQQHIEDEVKAATEPLVAKLEATERLLVQQQQGHYDTLAAKIDGIANVKSEADKQSEIRRQRARWVITTLIGAVLGTVAALKTLGMLP